jgi:hypothetical protein
MNSGGVKVPLLFNRQKLRKDGDPHGMVLFHIIPRRKAKAYEKRRGIIY